MSENPANPGGAYPMWGDTSIPARVVGVDDLWGEELPDLEEPTAEDMAFQAQQEEERRIYWEELEHVRWLRAMGMRGGIA